MPLRCSPFPTAATSLFEARGRMLPRHDPQLHGMQRGHHRRRVLRAQAHADGVHGSPGAGATAMHHLRLLLHRSHPWPSW